ncbi:TetR/AcrR family transcriptional regulator [Roseibium sp. SCP14]|uniref:TetR/AcrR family transcriptional regulator n=1 Tax=Roseibium sp. SCP14 TaxID=3141375 RepID=UPI003336D2FA
MAGRPRKIAAEYAEYSTREAILIAAEELCGEQGPSGFKLREIARRVGIEPASIYNHFQGLGGILSALIEEALTRETALLDFPEDLQGDAAIRELCLRSTRFFSERKGIVRLTLNDFAEVHDLEPNAFDKNEALIVHMLDLESEVIRRHLDLTGLSRRKLGEIAVSRRSMILSLLALTWLNKRETDAARVAEISDLASAFMLGLPSQLN